MDVSFKLEGADRILAKLKEVNNDVKRKGGRFALRKAGNILLDAAIENAKKVDDPATDVDISQAVAMRWNGRRFKQTGDLGFRVGVKGGARLEIPTGHWRLLEFGTKNMKAQPIFRPIIPAHFGAVQAEFIKQYGKALDRAIKRAKK